MMRRTMMMKTQNGFIHLSKVIKLHEWVSQLVSKKSLSHFLSVTCPLVGQLVSFQKSLSHFLSVTCTLVSQLVSFQKSLSHFLSVTCPLLRGLVSFLKVCHIFVCHMSISGRVSIHLGMDGLVLNNICHNFCLTNGQKTEKVSNGNFFKLAQPTD